MEGAIPPKPQKFGYPCAICNEKMEYKILFIIPLFSLLLTPVVYAHCPLCTAAVGAGVVVTRFYGVDDTIVGVWVGAFVVSTALWFNRILKKEYVRFQSFLLVLLALAFTIIPFYFTGLIGNPHYRLFGVDKILLGILSGSLMTHLGIFASDEIKKKRKKVLFPFQTIIVILIFLALASLLFWGVISFVV